MLFDSPVARNLPPARLPSAPRGSFTLVLLGAHRVLPGPLPCLTGSLLSSLSAPPLLIAASASLPLRRCCGCRRNAARRLLDDVQSQLACLPLQRLDLLLLHPGLVLLLTLAHVRQAVLQRQVDDPCQLVRRRGHGRLRPQPPFHPPQEPSQGPLAVVQALRRQPQRLRRAVHPPARPAGLDPAARLLPVGAQPQPTTELPHRRELRHPPGRSR